MKKVKKPQEINHLLTRTEYDLDKFHGKMILVGVSGGADSLCLLHILHRKGIKTLAVYVNHGLRKEATQDGMHVENICKEWQIPFQMVSINVQEYSQEEKIPLEEASRILRYRKLFSIAEDIHADAVAVAHHADDQVETVLMHLIRGAGMGGLRGMSSLTADHNWHSSIPLIRPLLLFWKDEIIAYCDENSIRSIQDESNFDTTFFRNRLRHELLPEMETYNPNFKSALLRMSFIFQHDYDLFSTMLESALTTLHIESNDTQVSFLRSAYLNLHISLQRMALRKMIAHLSPDLRDVDFAAIDRAIQFINEDSKGKQIDLVDDMILFIDEGRVVIKSKTFVYRRDDIPLIETNGKINIVMGKAYSLNGKWKFRIDVSAELPENDWISEGAYSVFVDAAKCGEGLFLRTVINGDRFTPCGFNGHSQKVSDIFTNMKISRWVRNNYPLVCDEKGILWIPRHRIADRVSIDQHTEQIYKISFIQQ